MFLCLRGYVVVRQRGCVPVQLCSRAAPYVLLLLSVSVCASPRVPRLLSSLLIAPAFPSFSWLSVLVITGYVPYFPQKLVQDLAHLAAFNEESIMACGGGYLGKPYKAT